MHGGVFTLNILAFIPEKIILAAPIKGDDHLTVPGGHADLSEIVINVHRKIILQDRGGTQPIQDIADIGAMKNRTGKQKTIIPCKGHGLTPSEGGLYPFINTDIQIISIEGFPIDADQALLNPGIVIDAGHQIIHAFKRSLQLRCDVFKILDLGIQLFLHQKRVRLRLFTGLFFCIGIKQRTCTDP